MSEFDTPQLTPLGATGVLARFGGGIDRDLSLRIARLVDRLDQRAIPGVADLVPAYTTLIVLFDPEFTDLETVTHQIVESWHARADSTEVDNLEGRSIEIPVVYGGDAGEDLAEVAERAGMSTDEVIRRHSDVTYTVGALGFAPGFAFLIGLPTELETPRRATPRTRVPAGSVAIGGAQTGIYSLPTPGGWSLIGRTPRLMFDPEGESDDELRPGDRVWFVPIPAEDAPPFNDPASSGEVPVGSDGALEVIAPGVQTTVQDLGRPGQGRSGITPGGALDRSALVAGNRLLGNPDGTAALEWTLLPPAIRFHEACHLVVTGADSDWRLNDRSVAIGEVIEVAPGDELRARPSQQQLGARGYLCVAGGIDVPVVRESRALDLSAGFGGGFGRPLQRGDRLALAEVAGSPVVDKHSASGSPGDPAAAPFRVVRGPQADRFDEAAWTVFLSESFTIDSQSNRMGLRLNGPALVPSGGADVISEGVVTGAIQVTGSGQPIVLLPGRATIGGYTKIATVIEADHDRLGQLRPGVSIRFAEVSIDEARMALQKWRPSVYGGLNIEVLGEVAMTDDMKNHSPSLSADGGAWTPDGVIRVIRELANHDVRAFSLRVEAAGLEIAIDRGGGFPERAARAHPQAGESTLPPPRNSEEMDYPQEEEMITIDAPLLGTFYRRPSPNEAMFAEEGGRVTAGQTVGLIEVMKSFHEVTAQEAGIVTRVLVDEGASVEFGQPLMELEPAPEGH